MGLLRIHRHGIRQPQRRTVMHYTAQPRSITAVAAAGARATAHPITVTTATMAGARSHRQRSLSIRNPTPPTTHAWLSLHQ